MTKFVSWDKSITLNEIIYKYKKDKTKYLIRKIDGILFRKWQAYPPFNNRKTILERLKYDQLNEIDFKTVLSVFEKDKLKHIIRKPKWITRFNKAFSHKIIDSEMKLPEENPYKTIEEFGYLILPLINQEQKYIKKEIENLCYYNKNFKIDKKYLLERFVIDVCRPLFMMISRVLILDLNVARLKGDLKGETAKNRYDKYIRNLKKPEYAMKIYNEYPVLARQVYIKILTIRNSYIKFIKRLYNDVDLLIEQFNAGRKLGTLKNIIANAGDTHKGSSVMIAEFSSGFKVAYKPRSMKVDCHFQNLLKWINQNIETISFKPINVINRGHYGWMEFVEHRECSSFEEVKKFYERIGGYLALLYILEATDFHYENIVASGENPVLIDLESLFHPRIETIIGKDSFSIAFNTILQSVLRNGLLPQRIWGRENYKGIDLSGIGASEGQNWPDKVIVLDKVRTDEINVVRRQMEFREGKNKPIIKGSKINVLDFCEPIVKGFVELYTVMIKKRNELTKRSNILNSFNNDEIRAIIRATRTYSLLWLESFHPDLLRLAIDRDLFFEKLWFGTENQKNLIKIIKSEQIDLMNGDIPFFSTHPNSKHIWDSRNNKIPNFINKSSMSVVKDKLKKINKDDLQKQIYLIRCSFATMSNMFDRMDTPNLPDVTNYSIIDSNTFRNMLVAEAEKIGKKLINLAYISKKDITWISLTVGAQGLLSISPLGMDLYSGLPGIMLFFGYLGKITGEKRYYNIVKKILYSIKYQINANKVLIDSIGAFSGWGGIIYSLIHISKIMNDESVVQFILNNLNDVSNLITKDTAFDIIGGSAGCIINLISLYEITKSVQILDMAIACGNHLIKNAKSMKKGIGWLVPIGGYKALAGFSHGSGGISYALYKLSAVTKISNFEQYAFDSLIYERSLFNKKAENWIDLRQSDLESKDYKFLTAWCHGAVGIGMSRLGILEIKKNEKTIEDEINIALRTTINYGFGNNHSLCHGDMGNIDFILKVMEIIKDKELCKQTEQFKKKIYYHIKQYGYISGLPARTLETVGLMLGISGIGYGLLRMAHPDLLPSILLLESPRIK